MAKYSKYSRVFLLGIYPEDARKAILLHIPVGLVPVAIAGVGYFIPSLLWIGIALAIVFATAFLVYQVVELLKVNLAVGWDKAEDRAYPELAGFCWGIFLGYIILNILAGVL